MSNWRKRQALASDQNSWRGMGVDTALWTSIDRNAGNVNTALGGNAATTTTGIVTDLKFQHAGVITTVSSGSNTVFVSDASNASVAAPTDGNGLWSTPYDASMNCRGSGLVFSIEKFGDPVQVNSVPGQDISAVKYAIIDGGSGYSVGETFSMGGVAPWTGNGVVGQIMGVTSTDPVQPRN